MVQGNIEEAVAGVLADGPAELSSKPLKSTAALLENSAHFGRQIANAEALVAAVHALRSTSTLEEALDGVMTAVRAIYGWRFAAVWLPHSETSLLVFSRSRGDADPLFINACAEAGLASGEALPGRVWASRAVMDCGQLECLDDDPLATAALSAGFSSAVAVPLATDQNFLGVMTFLHDASIEPDDERDHVLALVGWMTAQAMDGFHRQRERAEWDQARRALRSLRCAVSDATTPQEALTAGARALQGAFGWQFGCVWHLAQGPHIEAESGERPEGFDADIDVASVSEDTALAQAILSRQPSVPPLLQGPPSPRRARLDALGPRVAIPLILANQPLRAIELVGRASFPSPQERWALDEAARVLAFALQRLAQRQWDDRRMAELRAAVETVATGQLSRRVLISGHDLIAEVGDGFNRLIGNLAQNVAAARRSSHDVSEAAHELAGARDAMASTAQQFQAEVKTANGRTEGVSRYVQEVRESVNRIEGGVQSIAGSVEQAQGVVRQATELGSSTQVCMAELGKRSEGIGRAVHLIQAVAAQTNLLALNAAIEAARAGPYGKGFSVVATEVKELAKETARATEEIRRQVEDIQTQVGTSLFGLGNINKFLEQMQDISKQISERVGGQVQAATHVRAGLEEISHGTEDIVGHLGRLTSLSTNASASAQEAERAARRLTIGSDQMSRALQRLVAPRTDR